MGSDCLDDWPDGAVISVDATPALIALVALHEKFGAKPEMVVSGINRGANTGRAILHSGTVGAAFTASQYGCPALAVSLDVLDVHDLSESTHWDTAAAVATAGSRLDVRGPPPHGDQLQCAQCAR